MTHGRRIVHYNRLVDGVILFDGTCAFCERSVRFIASRDQGHFKFGASQNAEGQALLEKFGTTREATRSLILMEDGRLYVRSDAVLRIAGHLNAPWRYSRALLAVPRPIRDLVYRFVAAIRHRLAGRSNACEIPPPEIRARLI
jgi:predicted DCC family thiol-disulfide oxidoreductase YuxK